MNTEPSYLIVNADDYGYFDCVSKGILDSARHGIVTATGIFANSNQFDKHIDQLRHENNLDFGVHLNLTDHNPLTRELRDKLSRWGGYFPGKYTVVRLLLTGVISTEDVESEWRAQIRRCIETKLDIRFLNSHEHIHMVPVLFKVIHRLAVEADIPYVRFPTPELFQNLTVGALIRDGSMKLLGLLNRRVLTVRPLRFFGMGESGKLNVRYLQNGLAKLLPGQVYELMCHPGYYDVNEINNQKLIDYHDWQGEFDTLTNPKVRNMLHDYNVRLISYRHLSIQGDKFRVLDTLKT